MNRYIQSWLCVVGLFAVIGCNKPTNPKSEAETKAATDLKLFGLGYQNYLENNQRPPRNLDDLNTVISSDRPIEFDRYHIIWGVDLKSVSPGRTVLAYDVVVPEKGGMVLFHDLEVERVSAEEFAKLPRAAAGKQTVERPADVTFTPTEYYAEFEKLNMEMGRKYAGKVIELKGIVKGLDILGLPGRPGLLVISPGKKQEDVRCFITEGEEFWTRIAKGQEVTVKGLVRHPQGSPMLIDCGIASSGPFTGVTINAEELAREFATDLEKAEAKYHEKSFILTGEVVSTFSWARYCGVKLKGAAGLSIECMFKSDPERDKKFVPGAKLKIYAENEGNWRRLVNCELISK